MDISLPVFREGTWDDGIWGEARTYRVRDFKGKVVVDLGAYNGQALEILDKQLGPYEVSRENFDEGDGVLIIELDLNPNLVASSDDAPVLAPTKSEAPVPSEEAVTE